MKDWEQRLTVAQIYQLQAEASKILGYRVKIRQLRSMPEVIQIRRDS